MIISKKTISMIMLVAAVVLGIAALYLLVRPGDPDFNVFAAGPERKKAFFNYFSPIVQQRNQEILETRQQLREWQRDRSIISWWDARKIQNLAEDFRMESFDIKSDADWNTLLQRVDIVPASLALAQAAKESAWGDSRFAHQGYNFFGEWCFDKGCGMVPYRRDALKAHEVAVFDSPEASVESYIHNLNSHDAYQTFRDIRAELRESKTPVTGLALAAGLGSYSERGVEYIKEIRSLIRYNDLTNYEIK